MKISASLLAVAWFCIGATAVASDLYVNNKTGSDTNSGVADVQRGPGVGPMRSITRALKAAKAGDTIVVANTDEPYRESLTLQGAKHSTNGVQPFRIQGNNAIIDGTVIVDDEAWEHAVKNVFSFKPHLLTYQQLYHRGKPLSRVQVDAIDQLADLEPLQWAMLDGRIYFCAEEDRLPQYYDLSYCGHPVGVTLYNVQGVVLEDLIIQGFQLDGLNAHDNVFDATILGSTLRGNGRSGIHIGGACRVKIEACLVGNNGKAQIDCSDYCRVTIEQCDLVEDAAVPTIKAASTPRIQVDGQAYEATE
jgi:hypothetical protein